jgi:hypothetical protein
MNKELIDDAFYVEEKKYETATNTKTENVG